MKQYYSYQEIFLIPRYSEYHSRSEVDTSVKLGGKSFKIPVMPANMKCTINQKLALWMSENDYFYVMHRFNANTEDAANTDNKKFIETANKDNWKNISISLGVKDEDYELIEYCIKNNLRIDYITIDIAHAHSVRMKEMLAFLNRMYRSSICTVDRPFIIAGNVAAPGAVVDLENWGADATKVGIAQGDACTTYGQTGFGTPMFTCIQECAEIATKPIIADGGIRVNGDFAKALVAGGHMVMAGSIFASCVDSPADTVVKIIKMNELRENMKADPKTGLLQNGLDEMLAKKTYKVYYGSASAKNKGANVHVEGRIVELECNKMTYAEKLNEITESIQSSISYAGGDLNQVQYGIRS
jgi:GMP reductase